MQSKTHPPLIWHHQNPSLPQGILVGADETQEWMLSWWWKHFSSHNDIPVVFIDFGMTQSAKKWCQKRGTLITPHIPTPILSDTTPLDDNLAKIWEDVYAGDFWQLRKFSLMKPFVLLNTPFQETIWIDIDCEIRGSLTHLFEGLGNKTVALPQEPKRSQHRKIEMKIMQEDDIEYNTGLIVFKHRSPLITQWGENTLNHRKTMRSDQETLIETVRNAQDAVHEFSPVYNWRPTDGENPDAIIIHWVAEHGKQEILKML